MSEKDFRSLPTFDALCRRLEAAESCLAAQGNCIEYLINQLQEREYEVTFLMNICHVVVPTSKIAGADGKLPAIRKAARDVYMEQGRAAIVEMFRARAAQEAAEHGEGVSAPEGASQERPGPTLVVPPDSTKTH